MAKSTNQELALSDGFACQVISTANGEMNESRAGIIRRFRVPGDKYSEWGNERIKIAYSLEPFVDFAIRCTYHLANKAT